MRRLLAAFVLPGLLGAAWFVVPLAAGSRTLVLRDVLNTHLGLRADLGERLRAGELPLVDPLRAGGQAALGNPNVVALYPDNLLLLVASTLWQLNAHFWLHWLAAFAAAYWLARAWGMSREAAVGAAAAYGFSGYLLSQMNLYNAVAAAALAPALVAAALECGAPETVRRGLLAVGLLWGLALLGGDPILAAMALVAALALGAARHGRAWPWARVAVALGAGTLVAAPQIVETARILAHSYRGFWGYAGGAGGGVRDPRAALELVVPLFFGRPDRLATWGNELFGGFPPLYLSLHPGLAALALAAAAGAPRARAARVAAVLALAGAALAFSGGLPLARALAALPGGALLRFPEKLFLWTALGTALAVGAGLERLLRGERRRTLGLAAGALALPLVPFALGGDGCPAVARALFAEVLPLATCGAEVPRWAVLARLGLATAALVALAAALARRRAVAAAAGIVALLGVPQLLALHPLLLTDDARAYAGPPGLAARLPTESVLAHGSVQRLFGGDEPRPPARLPPDLRYVWAQRLAFEELQPFAGRSLGRRYELDPAPDGLDAFVVQALAAGFEGLSDARRVALLRATGVDRLIVARPLEPESAGGARLELETEAFGRPLRVYEIPGALEEAALLGESVAAPTMNAGLEAVLAAGFDPRRTAVLAGTGAARSGPRGQVRVLRREPERLELEADSAAGGVLVVRRAYLPIWRVEIDGLPARPIVAQLTRLAVELPAGTHQVVFTVPRASLRWALAASALGVALLAWTTRRTRA